MPVKKLKEFLDKEKIKYVSIVHSPAYTAQEVAASAHITGKELAKTVIVQLDGEMAMAVLPANRKIVLQDLREVTGSDQVKFVAEEDFKKQFPDCETGAMPPLGTSTAWRCMRRRPWGERAVRLQRRLAYGGD